MTGPFAQAFEELRAVIAPPGVIDRREALARWKRRWIDEAAACVSMSGLDEIQQPSPKARAELLAIRTREQVLTLGRLLVEREGVLVKAQQAHPVGGGTEYRLGLCVVRAEPKAPPGEAWLEEDGKATVRIVNLASDGTKP